MNLFRRKKQPQPPTEEMIFQQVAEVLEITPQEAMAQFLEGGPRGDVVRDVYDRIKDYDKWLLTAAERTKGHFEALWQMLESRR